MSWIFGVCSNTENLRSAAFPCHEPPLYRTVTPRLYLAAGGNPDTTFWDSSSDGSAGWIVVGTGITGQPDCRRLLDRDDWHRLLSSPSFDHHTLDGHFIALRWGPRLIEVFSDQLGLRTVYFGRCETGVCLSTRLDWLTRTTGLADIDYEALGSRWLMFNQLTYESGIMGIDRLGPGGHARINETCSFQQTWNPWAPRFEKGDPKNLPRLLKGILHCAVGQKRTFSLGLSGGVDSRLLLALLSSLAPGRFETHTFGNSGDPDVVLARRIASSLGVTHTHLDGTPEGATPTTDELRQFAAQTCLVEPVSSFLKLRHYDTLRTMKKTLVDGGFGEIGRRQYLNRIVRFGRSALRSKDSSRLLPLMRTPRANIFSTEITGMLERGAHKSLDRTLHEMPAVEAIGAENFADLLAVRTRLPNYGGPEQARLDGIILNYMPLAQPSFLEAVFGISGRGRSNAALYYEMIRASKPELAGIPLAKGGCTYRFGLSTPLTWAVVKLKSKLPTRFEDPGPSDLLMRLKEFVLDTLHSRQCTENPVYDRRKITSAVGDFYDGATKWRTTVDWWLTFELWRQSLCQR